MLDPSNRALINADPKIALTSRKHRAHDLLSLDHLAEKAEIMDLPGKLATQNIRKRLQCLSAIAGERHRLMEHEDVSSDKD